ncbi:MAG: hypothetical protein ACR2GC_10530 [Methyloceanibacter sp.]|uniref:hypothetical protein n=1 Tax=Methyloceanibacter sp. TaxID=1965321 RepID=UPI003D9AE4CD
MDRLERLVRERTAASTSPLYLRDGEPVPEGVDPDRVIFVKRVLIDPPEREPEELPEIQADAPPQVTAPKNFNRLLPMPELGIV